MLDDIICRVLYVLNGTVMDIHVYQRQDWQILYLNKYYYISTRNFLLDHLSKMFDKQLSWKEICFFMTIQKKHCSVQSIHHPYFGNIREVVLSKKNCEKWSNFPPDSFQICKILHTKIHGQISGKKEFVKMHEWFRFVVQTF
jgi:hypothetical protein